MTVERKNNHVVGFLCEGCDAHAYVVGGFRGLPEAFSYARHVLGWVVMEGGDIGVFCPECSGKQTAPPVHGVTSINRGTPLREKIVNSIRVGNRVDCETDDWPEVQKIIVQTMDELIDNRKWVLAGHAQDELNRLIGIYGDSLR